METQGQLLFDGKPRASLGWWKTWGQLGVDGKLGAVWRTNRAVHKFWRFSRVNLLELSLRVSNNYWIPIIVKMSFFVNPLFWVEQVELCVRAAWRCHRIQFFFLCLIFCTMWLFQRLNWRSSYVLALNWAVAEYLLLVIIIPCQLVGVEVEVNRHNGHIMSFKAG